MKSTSSLTSPVVFRRVLLSVFALISLVLAARAQPAALFSLPFDFGSGELNAGAAALLGSRTTGLDAPGQYRVHLIGHTDRVGDLAYNEALSLRRAAAVREALVAAGFRADRIELAGRAYLDPVDESDTEEGRARNRRVDVIIERAEGNVAGAYFVISASRPAELHYERSGARLHVPAAAFVDRQGRPVRGDVVVFYREFRDFADFMNTDLPMNFRRDGADHFFISTGMFEVRAYQGEEELALRADAELGLDFVQTDVRPGVQVWRYDERSRGWENGDAVVRMQDYTTERVVVDTARVDLGKTTPGFYREPPAFSRSPELADRLNAVVARLSGLIDTAAAFGYQYIPALDPHGFRDRFTREKVRGNYAGGYYVGHLPFEVVYADRRYYNVEAELVRADYNHVYFRLVDHSGANPELSALSDVLFRADRRDGRERKLARRYADLRLIRDSGRRGRLQLQLKYRDTLDVLPVDLIAPDGRRLAAKEQRLRYARYARLTRQRRDTLDAEVAANRRLLQDIAPALRLSLPADAGLDDTLRAALTDLLRMPDYGVAAEIAGRTRGAWLPENTPGMTLLCRYGAYLRATLGEEWLRSRTLPEWQERLGDGTRAFSAGELRYADIQTALTDPAPRLQLKGLGVFNLDVLKRFEKEQHLMADFRDGDGRRIDFERVEVINHRLNGLLRFTSGGIYLDLAAPTTLVVHARDGKVFYLKPAALAGLPLRGKASFRFTLEELGDYVADPAVVRQLLRG